MTSAQPPTLLLRSAWQDCNIGDVAHTPGVLALLEKYVPEAQVILWPWTPLTPSLVRGFRERFPNLRIVDSKCDEDGQPDSEDLATAFEQSDLFLHGSGPATIAWADADAFHRLTGRPFGVFGVTYGLYGALERETLSKAAFVYFRDSRSLARATSEGVRAPVIDLSPDTAFAFDLRDAARADAYIHHAGLTPGEFLCCIPRMRCTPFWQIARKNAPFDTAKHARNEETKERDHAQLREAIIAVVRGTRMKVLVCPEDETQISIGRELLVNRLPADVRERVVQRDTFWGPDEALSVYLRSAGLFGNEMHSPILCISHGIPAVVCHSADASTKGFMWQDIGLADWLFDIDVPHDYERIVSTVLSLAREPAAAKAKAEAARATVSARLSRTTAVVRDVLYTAHRGRGHPATDRFTKAPVRPFAANSSTLSGRQ